MTKNNGTKKRSLWLNFFLYFFIKTYYNNLMIYKFNRLEEGERMKDWGEVVKEHEEFRKKIEEAEVDEVEEFKNGEWVRVYPKEDE